jgi:hypothetical protein
MQFAMFEFFHDIANFALTTTTTTTPSFAAFAASACLNAGHLVHVKMGICTFLATVKGRLASVATLNLRVTLQALGTTQSLIKGWGLFAYECFNSTKWKWLVWFGFRHVTMK